MERGLPTYIKAVAGEVRHELGLSPFCPVDTRAVCSHLEIPLLGTTQLDLDQRATEYLCRQGDSFSAATGFIGTQRFFIVNDRHHPHRQASSIAHELGHALLHHPPSPILSGDGYRSWDGELEEQAAYFAGVLLVSDEACRWILSSRQPIDSASDRFGVSRAMIEYRLNKSGARRIRQRQLAKR